MKLKRISDVFWSVSPNLFYFSIIMGMVTGLSYALLIPFLMSIIGSGKIDFEKLHDEGTSFFNSPTTDIAIVFVSACILIILVKTLSDTISLYIAGKASMQHRLKLYQKIQRLSYIDLKRYGQSKLINLLKIDVPEVTSAAMSYPALITNSLTVVGILLYLVYIDIRVFFVVLGCSIFAIVIYQIPIYFGLKRLRKARNYQDKIQVGLNGLVLGCKELKLNRHKADVFYLQELFEPEQAARQAKFKGNAIFMFAENLGDSFYI